MIIEKAKEWLKKAETDLKVANILIREGIMITRYFILSKLLKNTLRLF